MLEHYAYALRGQRVACVVVLVVVAVVGLQAEVAAFREQIFDVEVADEAVAVHRVVVVAEVAVEQQAVVEQMARQREGNLRVGEVALVGAYVGRDGPVVAQLAEHVGQLA